MRTREGEREREREREREIERGRESEREGEGEGERGDVAAKSELTSKIGCWVIPPLKQTSAEKKSRYRRPPKSQKKSIKCRPMLTFFKKILPAAIFVG